MKFRVIGALSKFSPFSSQEKSGPKLGGETLMVRGLEYAKFLNSLQTPKTNGILPKYL